MLPLFPIFVIFFIGAVAETNRAPFDLAEAMFTIKKPFKYTITSLKKSLPFFYLNSFSSISTSNTNSSLNPH